MYTSPIPSRKKKRTRVVGVSTKMVPRKYTFAAMKHEDDLRAMCEIDGIKVQGNRHNSLLVCIINRSLNATYHTFSLKQMKNIGHEK